MKKTILSRILMSLLILAATSTAAADSAVVSTVVKAAPNTLMDTCFSPGGGCDQKLISFINNTRTSLDIAIYSLTHQGIAQAIIAAKSRGVAVRIIMDKGESKASSSSYKSLVAAGISVRIGNVSGLFHDKYTISDGGFLEMGSYNYTQNATSNNAENQLYLNDPTIISRYQGDFNDKWSKTLN